MEQSYKSTTGLAVAALMERVVQRAAEHVRGESRHSCRRLGGDRYGRIWVTFHSQGQSVWR